MMTALRVGRDHLRVEVDRCLAGGDLDQFVGLAAALSDADRFRDVWLPAWARPPVPRDERWVEPGLWLGRNARRAGLVVPPALASALGELAKRASLLGDWRPELDPAVPEDAWAAAAALGWVAGPVLDGFEPAFVRRFGSLPAARTIADWEAWRWPDAAVALGFGRIVVTASEVRVRAGGRVLRSIRPLERVVSARVEVSTGRAANRFVAIVEGVAGRRRISAQRARVVVEDDGPAAHDGGWSVEGRFARFEWT